MRLSEYVDERLTPEEQEVLQRHLQGCDACRHELDLLKATVNLLHRVPDVTVPRSFAIAEIEPRAARVAERLPLNWLRPATAVAVVLLAFLLASDFSGLFVPKSGKEVMAPQIESQISSAEQFSDEKDVQGEGGSTRDKEEVSGEEASTWLRPAEIAASVLVVTLGGTTAFAIWQRRRAVLKAKPE